MLLRSDFDMQGVVGEVVGTIASVSLDDVYLECMFVEGYIVSNIDWLGLLGDF